MFYAVEFPLNIVGLSQNPAEEGLVSPPWAESALAVLTLNRP